MCATCAHLRRFEPPVFDRGLSSRLHEDKPRTAVGRFDLSSVVVALSCVFASGRSRSRARCQTSTSRRSRCFDSRNGDSRLLRLSYCPFIGDSEAILINERFLTKGPSSSERPAPHRLITYRSFGRLFFLSQSVASHRNLLATCRS